MKFINCWNDWSEHTVINVLRLGRQKIHVRAADSHYYRYFIIILNFGISYETPLP